jgi:hypothetical protein
MKDAVIRGRSMLKRDASMTEVMLFEAKLWLHKQEYQRRAQSLKDDGERIRFFLSELKNCWSRVVNFQKAIGLESAYFSPYKDFIRIYAATWNLEKLVNSGNFSYIDMTENWGLYLNQLISLGHDLNPFDFTDRSFRCLSLMEQLNGGMIEAGTIPLQDIHRARLGGFQPPETRLEMKR